MKRVQQLSSAKKSPFARKFYLTPEIARVTRFSSDEEEEEEKDLNYDNLPSLDDGKYPMPSFQSIMDGLKNLGDEKEESPSNGRGGRKGPGGGGGSVKQNSKRKTRNVTDKLMPLPPDYPMPTLQSCLENLKKLDEDEKARERLIEEKRKLKESSTKSKVPEKKTRITTKPVFQTRQPSRMTQPPKIFIEKASEGEEEEDIYYTNRKELNGCRKALFKNTSSSSQGVKRKASDVGVMIKQAKKVLKPPALKIKTPIKTPLKVNSNNKLTPARKQINLINQQKENLKPVSVYSNKKSRNDSDEMFMEMEKLCSIEEEGQSPISNIDELLKENQAIFADFCLNYQQSMSEISKIVDNVNKSFTKVCLDFNRNLEKVKNLKNKTDNKKTSSNNNNNNDGVFKSPNGCNLRMFALKKAFIKETSKREAESDIDPSLRNILENTPSGKRKLLTTFQNQCSLLADSSKTNNNTQRNEEEQLN